MSVALRIAKTSGGELCVAWCHLHSQEPSTTARGWMAGCDADKLINDCDEQHRNEKLSDTKRVIVSESKCRINPPKR